MESYRLSILGCGSSGGVPRVGGGWGACDPKEKRNRRRRCSLLIERHAPGGTTRLLIDASPDMRAQLLDAKVDHLHGLVFTHAHADHLHGIDDIRPLVLHSGHPLDLYADTATGARIRASFGYIVDGADGGFYPPVGILHTIAPHMSFEVDGPGGQIALLPLDVTHGPSEALGFRSANFAYLPDVSAFSDETEEALRGLDLLILDALRYRPHKSHFSLSEALAWIERLSPKRAILTNLHNDLDYRRLCAETPEQIEPAFDGLTVNLVA